MISLCFIASLLAFEVHNKGVPLDDVSESYRNKWIRRSLPARYKECRDLVRIATRQSSLNTEDRIATDVLWVLSIAIVETGFNNRLVSSAGARSTMQTYRRWSPCGENCDLRLAGVIHAMRLYQEHGICEGAAKYNGGPAASCDTDSGPSRYALKVMDTYGKLCERTHTYCGGC